MSTERLFLRTLVIWLSSLRLDRDLSSFAVAFEIGRQAGRTSCEAWPTVRSIARNLRMSEATVRPSIAWKGAAALA